MFLAKPLEAKHFHWHHSSSVAVRTRDLSSLTTLQAFPFADLSWHDEGKPLRPPVRAEEWKLEDTARKDDSSLDGAQSYNVCRAVAVPSKLARCNDLLSVFDF